MYKRKYKEKFPVIAICYDFDKTLSPKDMQAQGFIQDIGYDVNNFWEESNALATANDMDTNLAYMYKMVEKSQRNFRLDKKILADYGAKVELFPGVKTWFKRIRDYGKKHNIIIEHYIISSGLKEMIEGTVMAQEFEKIYAPSRTSYAWAYMLKLDFFYINENRQIKITIKKNRDLKKENTVLLYIEKCI